ncbi:MAG TPA: glycosyltransferase [Gaiellaceae bacterium]|jgi:glycosyltransferase involved in cell wall biosynthesis
MREISVVVCTRNRPGLLARALASLAGQTLDRDRFEIVVADNGDGSGVEVAQHAGADLALRVAEAGVSGTRNAGWRAAGADRFAFLDDDAEAGRDWLEIGLGLLGGGAAAAGGPILPSYESAPPAWFRDEYELRSWGDEQRPLVPGESFSASNLFLLREPLETLGGFDLRLGMRGKGVAVGEEPAFFEQLWRRRPGTTVIYSPNLVVRHLVAARKTTVSYQLRRAAAAGEAWAVHTSSGRRDAGRMTRDVAAAVALSARAVTRPHRPWQRWAVEELGPVAGRIGSIRGSLR